MANASFVSLGVIEILAHNGEIFPMKTVMTSTVLAAALALGASVGLTAPAAAHEHHHHHSAKHVHNASARGHSYQAGYNHGWRDAQRAADVDDGDVVEGRSVAVGPAGDPYYDGPFDNGGLAGTGVLAGDGVLGTGVLSGRGALGIGVLGF